MKKKLSAAAMGAAALLTFAGTAGADTLLGSNYAGGSFSMTHFGDERMDDVFGSSPGLKGFGDINLHPNLDLQWVVGYSWDDGSDSGVEVETSALTGGMNLLYAFKPGEQLNPFVKAGFNVYKKEYESSGYPDEDDSGVGFVGGAGLEFEATRKILLNAGADYWNYEGDDDIMLSGQFGYWFHQRILGFVAGYYSCEWEDTTGEIGLIFKL